jgi:hypothetical protein
MKTQILMNENNIDWKAVLSDGEEKPIFEILKQMKTQLIQLDMLDNASNQATFSDYLVSEMKYLKLMAVIEINGNVEQRNYTILKKANGWSVISEFMGVKQPIAISINEAQTTVDNHVVVDVVGSGAGDDASITLIANTKTSS